MKLMNQTEVGHVAGGVNYGAGTWVPVEHWGEVHHMMYETYFVPDATTPTIEDYSNAVEQY